VRKPFQTVGQFANTKQQFVSGIYSSMDVTHYKFIVPNCQRKLILEKNHDSAVCGHLGFEK
jgi:hypothetical protein